jgi:O-antigen chain-terminating methyltransferase
MRRIIEELVVQRTEKQERLRDTLDRLGKQLQQRGWLRKKSENTQQVLSDLHRDICDLVTVQDKEWDAMSNNHNTMVHKSLHWKIDKLQAEYSHVKTLLMNFTELEKSLENIIASIDSHIDPTKIEKLKEIKNRLSVYQYSDFEQRFRGSQETVTEKLKKYLPIFTGHEPVVDIGCGRGEFVAMLRDTGQQVEGIDISDSMLKEAQEKGLPCRKQEALPYLLEKDSDSLGGVFSAQVIEHFEPDYLKDVVAEAYRVLKAGGPILLETVNPLSLFALSNIYFLDVTHQKPLHPEYMRYLLESCGFSDVEIIYPDELAEEKLEEMPPEEGVARIFNTNVDKLNKIIFSSPVYAAKGVKR